MNDRNAVIERIRKLLALSQSPNENEAASAAAKAQAMLAEHNLHISEVEQSGHKVEQFVIDNELITESVPWRRQIVQQVAKMYFCTYFYTHIYEVTASRSCGYIRRDTHTFVGAEHNIEVARMMARYLMDTVERLAREGASALPIKRRTGYMTSFKHACAQRLAYRIRHRIEEAKRGGVVKTETGTTLPALANLYQVTQTKLDEYVEKNVGKLKTSKYRPTITDQLGYQHGHEAGNEIGLDAQVGANKARHVETSKTKLLK